MVSLIILLPFFSFLSCSVGGGARFYSERGLQIFVSFLWVFIWSLIISLFSISGNLGISYQILFLEWFKVFPLSISWSIEINKVTLTMLLLIITVSTLVHIFSLNYMAGEPHLSRFLGYLGLFTFFMLILVTSPNLVQLFIGWEGVGVCSYLLINFWSTRLLAAQSAYKAMIVNKIGDMAILISIGILVKEVGSININLINSTGHWYKDNNVVLIASILLLIGVVGKSAQVGLHMWLPDAMEGPTPVSALIHAATMVTAGVFLIIKLSPFFINFNVVSFLIMIVGSLTCLMAAIIGSTQSDLKKIIAYSTCSQLGYMVLVCGYGYYTVSLFHLFNHGIFKALLFLSAGLIIHTLFNEQNLLKMGLFSVSPTGRYGFVIGNLAIVGFPFLTGYYSKDLFLELIAAHNIYLYPLWLGYLAASLTCFYSLKLLWLSYKKEKRYNPIFSSHFHANSLFILTPLLILGVGSILFGYILFGELNNPIKPIIVSNLTKQIPILLAILIIVLSMFNTLRKVSLKEKFVKGSLKMFINSFYFNEVISKLNIYFGGFSFLYTYKLIDSQTLEWVSTTTSSKFLKDSSSRKVIYEHHNIKTMIKSLIMGIFLLYFIFF